MNTFKDVKPRSRTLKRDTLKALERAAMRWMNMHGHVAKCDCYQCKSHKSLYRAIVAHAQSQAGGKRRERGG